MNVSVRDASPLLGGISKYLKTLASWQSVPDFSQFLSGCALSGFAAAHREGGELYCATGTRAEKWKPHGAQIISRRRKTDNS
jgi:hypothetical protein